MADNEVRKQTGRISSREEAMELMDRTVSSFLADYNSNNSSDAVGILTGRGGNAPKVDADDSKWEAVETVFQFLVQK